MLNTFVSHDLTVPLDHVTEKSSVDIPSADEVPIDLSSSISDYTVTLDQCITEKFESTAPLGPLSARSVVPVPLGLDKKSSLNDSLVIDSSADVAPLGQNKTLPTITD